MNINEHEINTSNKDMGDEIVTKEMSKPDNTGKQATKKNDHSNFTDKIRRLNALACNNYKREDFDVDEAMENSERSLEALGATGGLQEMIAAQLLSTHRMQQLSTALANESEHIDNKQYYTNAAVKLANCFIQQASLLARLQGNGGQKITIERVDVHHGGQAIVGNITRDPPDCEVKK